jgi:hypothetical protein
MRYTVYQLQVSKQSPEDVIEFKRDLMFDGSECYRAEMSEHFVKVAEVEASDLDDVFHIGNGYGDQSKIQRVAERMHSVSVGDIIQTQDGYLWMVDPEGFKCVGTNKIGEAA